MARARGGEGEGGEVLTFTQQLDRLEEIVRRLEAQ